MTNITKATQNAAIAFETYSKFVKINKIAGYLLIPYLAWVSFATVLNESIWWLNR